MRKFFDKKLIINLVISFITIVVALVNIFFFSGQFGGKDEEAKAAGTNYKTDYQAIFTPEIISGTNPPINCWAAGCGVNASDQLPIKTIAWTVNISSLDGVTPIAKEVWAIGGFYLSRRVTTWGVPIEGPEGSSFCWSHVTGTYFDRTGRMFDPASNQVVSTAWIQHFADVDALAAAVAGLKRQYWYNASTNAEGDDPTHCMADWATEDKSNFPTASCNYNVCTNRIKALAGIDNLNSYGQIYPKQWYIRGELY